MEAKNIGSITSTELDFFLGGVLMEDARREWARTLRERRRSSIS